jgi:hypothetical protein
MWQRSEDAGRNLRGVWLGPEGAFRWWFDATFAEWLLGFAMLLPAFVVLWLVLPLGLLVILVSLSLSAFLARYASWGRFSKAANRWTYFGMLLVFCAALVPYPAAWLLPMSWWLALPSAVATCALIVRAARPYLDGNRPFSYWIATIHAITSGPRQLRPIAEIIPEGFTIIDGHDSDLGDDLWRFMTAINNADPKEAPVRRYRQITPEVEAVLWDIASGDEKTGHLVLAWLREKGLPVTVKNVKYGVTPGVGSYPTYAEVDLDGKRLPQKCVIFLHKGNPRMWGTRTVEAFTTEFEEVPLEITSHA